MSNVEFQNAIPEEFVLQTPTSTSKSILRKNLMEILPIGTATFSSGQNANISFQVSSNSDILCGDESYFRFDFRNSSGVNLVPATQYARPSCAFDVGGINALFKSVEVRSLGSGITLQRYDEYNRYNALSSLLYDSTQDVAQAACSGDDMTAESTVAVAVTGTAGSWVAATKTLTVTGGLLEGESVQGKILMCNGISGVPAPYSWSANVVSITSDTVVVLDNGPDANVTFASLSLVSLQAGLAPGGAYNWRRYFHTYESATGTHIITFKPRLSILKHNLPLFLMKGGIEIIFELADGGRGIQAVEPITLANMVDPISYEITRPRFFAQMITPHPDIVDEYIRQWKSPTGLVYSIPSVRSRRTTGPVTDSAGTALNYSVGVRSARRAYLVVQPDSLSQGASTSAIGNAALSVSGFPRTNIRYFQAKIGSHEYPNRAVQTISGNSSQEVEFTEAWQNLMMVAGPKIGVRRLRFSDHNSRDNNLYLTVAGADPSYIRDSRHFIMAFDFSRDKGMNGDLTGADLSIVPLAVDLARSSAPSYTGSYIYQLFVEHDSFLKISSEQMSVMN